MAAECPQCGRMNWYNAWLCIECGYPHFDIWKEYVLAGFIKPRTNEGKAAASRLMQP